MRFKSLAGIVAAAFLTAGCASHPDVRMSSYLNQDYDVSIINGQQPKTGREMYDGRKSGITIIDSQGNSYSAED